MQNKSIQSHLVYIKCQPRKNYPLKYVKHVIWNLIGERNGKEIGIMLNIAQKDVEEIKSKC